MASQGLEIEKKYDVGPEAVVPPLAGLPGVERVGAPHTDLLEAVYFDTDTHSLAARRITLRRRTGGFDAGWHLKLPPEPSPDGSSGVSPHAAPGDEQPAQQRRELRAPLGRPDVVPDTLLAHVQVYLRGKELSPVVRLETERTTYPLYGADGVHLADLADDHVTAYRLDHRNGTSGLGTQQWREWELELVHGDQGLFGPAGELLAAAGARPAGHGSKLAKALAGPGGATEGASGVSDAGRLAGAEPPALVSGRKAPGAAVVTVYLDAQIRQIQAHDPGIRREEPEAVHDMREAVRRIRSVLAAFRPLYNAVELRRLREELKWLGQVLGEPRDAEVMLSGLRRQIADLAPGQPPQEVEAASVKEQVERELGVRFDAGYRRLQETLSSERYFRLLDDLEAFRDVPPVRGEAAVSGRKLTARAVGKAAKRLRRSHKAAMQARRGTAHETALHQVRKDAKRLRHVAEAAGPVHGKRAAKVAKAAHRQQKILGQYQDAVMARDLLGTLSSAHELPASQAATYAELRTRQLEALAAAEARYLKARKKARRVLRGGVL